MCHRSCTRSIGIEGDTTHFAADSVLSWRSVCSIFSSKFVFPNSLPSSFSILESSVREQSKCGLTLYCHIRQQTQVHYIHYEFPLQQGRRSHIKYAVTHSIIHDYEYPVYTLPRVSKERLASTNQNCDTGTIPWVLI